MKPLRRSAFLIWPGQAFVATIVVALVLLALGTAIASPATASTVRDPDGNVSSTGFGWSFLIPAGVLGLVLLGALLATRVGRSDSPDPTTRAVESDDEDDGTVEDHATGP